jgi:hypothetical protein
MESLWTPLLCLLGFIAVVMVVAKAVGGGGG